MLLVKTTVSGSAFVVSEELLTPVAEVSETVFPGVDSPSEEQPTKANKESVKIASRKAVGARLVRIDFSQLLLGLLGPRCLGPITHDIGEEDLRSL